MANFGLSNVERKIIVIMLLGTVIVYLTQILISPALASIMSNMNVAAVTVQWLVSGFALVEAIVIPLSAYLMGRFGTRKLFIGALSIFVAGGLITAIAPNFAILLAGRMLQGAAVGIILPMTISVVLVTFPPEKRGAAMGMVGLILGFAPAMDPTVSGLVVDEVGWRILFVMVTALAGIALLVAVFAPDNVEKFERTNFDFLSVVLSTIGLLCLLYAISSFASSDNYFSVADIS